MKYALKYDGDIYIFQTKEKAINFINGDIENSDYLQKLELNSDILEEFETNGQFIDDTEAYDDIEDKYKTIYAF